MNLGYPSSSPMYPTLYMWIRPPTPVTTRVMTPLSVSIAKRTLIGTTVPFGIFTENHS